MDGYREDLLSPKKCRGGGGQKDGKVCEGSDH